jgi:hypothetical protein
VSTPILPYASDVAKPPSRTAFIIFGSLACAIAIFAALFPLPAVLELRHYPPGTSMRPMWAVTLIFLGSVTGAFVALPLAIAGLITGRRWRAGWILGLIAVFLAIASIFPNKLLFDHLVSSRGYVMEP